MSKGIKIAIVGATGAVGQEMARVLEQRNFPLDDIKFFASENSAGRRITFRRKGYLVETLDKNSFKGLDLALFSAGSSVSKEFAPIAAKNGCLVIDNSSAFRMDSKTPLVVPEVNPEAVANNKGIIANPNCSTIQMVVALKPIHDLVKIKRIVVTTLQAVSGTGLKAINELKTQVEAYAQHQEMEKKVYLHQIAFNVLPQIDIFLEDGSTKEEEKMVKETQKILDPKIKVSATTVRVPVFVGHSESINIETTEKITADKAREILSSADGLEVMDEPEKNQYPMPLFIRGIDNCLVGRIREDKSVENGLNLWVVADNLRKGAALNAVQIAELMLQKNLVKPN